MAAVTAIQRRKLCRVAGPMGPPDRVVSNATPATMMSEDTAIRCRVRFTTHHGLRGLINDVRESPRCKQDPHGGLAGESWQSLKSAKALPRGGTVVQVTLVGEPQAIEGREFVYRGPQPECLPCKVKAACLNQELGRRYRITKVRNVRHDCLLNEGKARVVEVMMAPPECSIAARTAVEGAVLAYEKIVCANAACPNYRLCHPIGIEPATRIRVVEVGPELDCPLGYSIVSAKVAYGD